MDRNIAKGIVEALKAVNAQGSVYLLGYLVDISTNDQGATWFVFNPMMTGVPFQYTPGGTWEELTYIDGELHAA